MTSNDNGSTKALSNYDMSYYRGMQLLFKCNLSLLCTFCLVSYRNIYSICGIKTNGVVNTVTKNSSM